jgi:ribosomal protein S10
MAPKSGSGKIRISVKAFDHRLLDSAVKNIVLAAKDS